MSKMNKLPPIERLKELFEYSAETGKLYWRVNKGRVRAGDEAGYRMGNGYLNVKLDQKYYAISRIAYALHHEVDPYPLMIDHINRVKDDNRICNLRAVTNSENMQNSGWRVTVSGHWGITEDNGGWKVVLRNKHRGRRKTLEETIKLRNEICEAEGITIPALCK